MYSRILLADDGSELARSAIPYAAALATASRAGVLVLRVSHAAGVESRALEMDSWRERVTGPRTSDREDERLEAYPPLSEVEAALRAAGVDSVGTLVVQDDDAGAAIVDTAARLGCDLIVMATHGLTGIRRAVLGSVADHVVRHTSKASVLLVRSQRSASNA